MFLQPRWCSNQLTLTFTTVLIYLTSGYRRGGPLKNLTRTVGMLLENCCISLAWGGGGGWVYGSRFQHEAFHPPTKRWLLKAFLEPSVEHRGFFFLAANPETSNGEDTRLHDVNSCVSLRLGSKRRRAAHVSRVGFQ